MKLVSTTTGQYVDESELVFNSVLGAYVYPEDSKDYYGDDELSDIEMFVEIKDDDDYDYFDEEEPADFYDDDFETEEDADSEGALELKIKELRRSDMAYTPEFDLEAFGNRIVSAYKSQGKNYNFKGAYIYCNAEDGTDFDWYVNDRTCEVRMENDDIDFEFFIRTSGEVHGYIWKHNESKPMEYIRDLNIKISEEDALEIAAALKENFDNNFLFDKVIFTIDK